MMEQIRPKGEYWIRYNGKVQIAQWLFNGRGWFWFTMFSDWGKLDSDIDEVISHIPVPKLPLNRFTCPCEGCKNYRREKGIPEPEKL